MKSEMKKEVLRKKLIVTFHFRRHVVLFPQALSSNIDREELGMVLLRGREVELSWKWCRARLLYSLKPVFKIISYQR